MTKEFLSQEEVDALLKGVGGEGEGEGEDAAGEPDARGGPRPFDFASHGRIVRGRLPALESVHERLARLLRTALFGFMRRTVEISVSPVKTQKYEEFVRNIPVPANFNVIRVKPLRGSALVVLEPALIFQVIDCLFGSDGRFQARTEGREFTATEHRIIQRLLALLFENLERAWQPVQPLKFEFVRAEVTPQFVTIATPGDLAVTVTITIELGAEVSGAVHLCLPWSMVEPIADRLSASPQEGREESGQRWLRMMSRQVQSAEVELTATLCRTMLSLEQVMKLKAGDVFDIPIQPTVVAAVDEVPVMECRYGVANGQYALQVVRMIHHDGADEAADRPAA